MAVIVIAKHCHGFSFSFSCGYVFVRFAVLSWATVRQTQAALEKRRNTQDSTTANSNVWMHFAKVLR